MVKRTANLNYTVIATALICGLAAAPSAQADSDLLKLKNHTEVKLALDDALSSKTAKAGDMVHFHLSEPVTVSGKTVIASGAPVVGRVTKVNRRGHFGTNAKIQLELSPVKTVAGTEVPLGFKTKTNDMARPGAAAGTSVGAAVLLGPVGLAGGYFVVGKEVKMKPGDKLSVEVSKDTLVKAVL